MELEFKELDKKDYKKIIEYAIKGMHFNMYFNNKTLVNLYGKYFWYSELLNATDILAVYHKDALAGVLLIDMNGRSKCYKSVSKSILVKCVDFLQEHFFKDSAGSYDEVNDKMLTEYKKKYSPDGEINFLAANTDLKIKGIGTALINELSKREKGKEIYLFTDDLCTYQFYEHRGFEKMGEEDITMDSKKKLTLKCFLYRKKL